MLQVLSLAGLAQTTPLSGVVRDAATALPLPGVTVAVKGTTRGTVTNAEGAFSLQAAQGEVLVFTQVGMTPQEIPVGSQTSLTIDLAESAQNLDEVVVIGYGEQSRRRLTGSVSSVGQEVLRSVPRTNVATALQGTTPGLRVQQITGQPGATPRITFRGGTNYDGTGTPLFVVDGVIVPSLYGISQEDIESIDVLKDAASAAIYGARASNGVVLVTTKKGRSGRTSVTYSYKNATNYIRRNPVDFMSAEDYIRWNRLGLGARFQAAQADGNTAEMNNSRNQVLGAWGFGNNSGWTAPDGKYSTQLVTNANRSLLGNPLYHLLVDKNPFDATRSDSLLYRSISQRDLENLILQQSQLQEHYVNVAGGSETGTFSLGIGSLKDVGIVVGSGLKRLNLNFNGGLNVGKNLRVNLNMAAYNVNTTPSYLTADNSGGLTGGLIQRFGGIAPTVRLTHDLTGAVLPGVDGSTLGNPLYFRDKFSRITNEQRYSGGLNVEYNIMPGLKLIGSASGFYRYNEQNSFDKAYQNGTGGAMITTRNASFGQTKAIQYTYNGFVQYQKDFDRHSLTLLAGGEFFESRQYNYSAASRLAPSDFIPWLSSSTEAVGIPFSGFTSWQRLASAIGRANYSYDNRFLLNAIIRYDGTSRLTNNRYGLFPGLSAGWNLHQENFFKNSGLNKTISTLKPRISWGETGNLASLDDYGDYPTVPVFANQGLYNGQPATAIGSINNPNLRWERASTMEFGVDLGLFNDRLTLIGEYYIRNVYDKLSTLPIPGSTGFSSYLTNIGQLQNRGIDLAANLHVLRPSQPGGLAWRIGTNLSHVKNFAVKLPGNGLPLNRQGSVQLYSPAEGRLVWVGGLQEGRRVGLDEIYAPTYDGLYRTQADIDARANFVNTYLPYTNKKIKLLGDARWRDTDGNDSLDYRDFVYVGRTTPTLTGGFSSTLSWKGFTLYGQFDYALGFVIVNQAWLRGMSQVQGSQNGPVDVTRTWTPENPNAELPRYYWANYARNYFTDAGGNATAPANFWQRGNYVALRELTLSYDLPGTLLERGTRNRIKSLRLFATGANLAYFTQYNGTFPEAGGNDVGRFPLPRTVTFGASISL